MGESRNKRLLLAGNPNSGKTSIFNALTGARQRVGNYPGVTVERRDGHYTFEGLRYDVTDLPGTYSLTSYSPEERIAQDELLAGGPDVVVVVVDTTTLNRSLMILAQIMQLGANPVLCLNMSDEAARAGLRVDVAHLEVLLGFPVVETVGHRGAGVDKLRVAVDRAVRHPYRDKRLVFGERMDDALATIGERLAETDIEQSGVSWVAQKLLVDDPAFSERVYGEGEAGKRALDVARDRRRRIESETGIDISLFVAERYYGFVDGLLREVVRSHPRENARELSDRIDSILVHRIFGIPVFLAVMYGIFWVTFSVGEYPMGWLESGFAALGERVSGFWPPGSGSPIRSLLVDGIIGGVGGVVVFLPNIILLFLGLVFLEDTGYMARAAFLMDRVMHRFGLHGKSFIPMMTGFGCSIPGIMATRTLENERDRLTTMLVLPLISCGARLPIWMLLIPAFFAPSLRAPMLWFIYTVGIALALLLALLLRKSILSGEDAPFVMELPPYRMPTVRAVLLKMFERSWLYLRKAGTIILGISILMWLLTAYPKPETYEVDRQVAAGEQIGETEVEHRRAAEELEHSIAGRIGQAIEPLIAPLGFDWKIGTAMIGAFAAKEVFVAQMGIVYSLGEIDEESLSLRETLSRDYTPLVGVSMMLFLLIATPCMATIAITRRESGSWKWALLQLGGLTALAYVISLAVYQIGRLLG
jgi:ferrous iron transport protein B